MKTCTKCGETKPLDQFHRQVSKKDGRKAACARCGTAAAKRFYHANRDHFLLYAKTYMQNPVNRQRRDKNKRLLHIKDPRPSMVTHAKRRACRDGLPFDLVVDDLTVPTACPVLGILLVAGGSKRQHDASPTIDRIEPAKGYVRGNVTVISWRANRLKSDATLGELRAVVRYYEAALGVAVTFAARSEHHSLSAEVRP